MIRKRTKDGFRNPKYDELNRRLGVVVFSLLGIGFIVLFILLFIGST